MNITAPPARVAVVTGAAGGIGRAIVEVLRERDWQVIGTDVRAPDASSPLDCTFVPMDVTDTAPWMR